MLSGSISGREWTRTITLLHDLSGTFGFAQQPRNEARGTAPEPLDCQFKKMLFDQLSFTSASVTVALFLNDNAFDFDETNGVHRINAEGFDHIAPCGNLAHIQRIGVELPIWNQLKDK